MFVNILGIRNNEDCAGHQTSLGVKIHMEIIFQTCQPLRFWRISYYFWLFLLQLRLLRILMIFYSFWESFMHVNLSLISRIYYLWKTSYNLLFFFHYINIIFYAATFIRLIWYQISSRVANTIHGIGFCLKYFQELNLFFFPVIKPHACNWLVINQYWIQCWVMYITKFINILFSQC